MPLLEWKFSRKLQSSLFWHQRMFSSFLCTIPVQQNTGPVQYKCCFAMGRDTFLKDGDRATIWCEIKYKASAFFEFFAVAFTCSCDLKGKICNASLIYCKSQWKWWSNNILRKNTLLLSFRQHISHETTPLKCTINMTFFPLINYFVVTWKEHRIPHQRIKLIIINILCHVTGVFKGLPCLGENEHRWWL